MYKKSGYVCVLICLLFMRSAEASTISVAPLLIDSVVEPRDIVTHEITVINNSPFKQFIYATINEVSVSDGRILPYADPANDERKHTPTSWVEITRGRIELDSGAETVIPLTIRVHPDAPPGEYHLMIGFGAGSKRYEVEQAAAEDRVSSALIKLSIREQQNQLLRISSFLIDRFILSNQQKTVAVTIENTGTSPTLPTGEIIFYDSKGEEVAAVPLEETAKAIGPGERQSVSAAIPFDSDFGRYKANVVLRYGAGQTAAVFDTTQFFIIPLPILIGLLLAIVFCSFLLTYLLRRAFQGQDEEDSEGVAIPLYVRTDREHNEHEHDINLTKS